MHSDADIAAKTQQAMGLKLSASTVTRLVTTAASDGKGYAAAHTQAKLARVKISKAVLLRELMAPSHDH